MRALLVLLVAAVTFMVAAPAASASATLSNATTECIERAKPHADYALGANTLVYAPTDYTRWASNDWSVRVRFQRSYVDRVMMWYNCRLTGNGAPDGGMQNVSFSMVWAAPSWGVAVDSVPNWQYRLHPFVDPVTGNPW